MVMNAQYKLDVVLLNQYHYLHVAHLGNTTYFVRLYLFL